MLNLLDLVDYISDIDVIATLPPSPKSGLPKNELEPDQD